MAGAVEAELRVVAGEVGLREFAVLRARLQIRQPGSPAVTRADVAAGVRVDDAAAGAVLVALGAGKAGAVARFSAEFEELLGRRDPFELHAVVAVLPAEECLVRERGVDEVPDVLVLLVQVAQAGEKAAELGRQPVGQRGQDAVGLFDRHGVLRRQRDDQVARELVVDVGGDRELRFAQRKAALARSGFAARGKSADRVFLGVLRQVGVTPLKHRRNRRIERGKTARRG